MINKPGEKKSCFTIARSKKYLASATIFSLNLNWVILFIDDVMSEQATNTISTVQTMMVRKTITSF